MGEYSRRDYIYIRYLEDVPNYKQGDIIRMSGEEYKQLILREKSVSIHFGN